MKIGTLYDLAKQQLPDINKNMFTIMYNEALAKITQDLRVDQREVTMTSADFSDFADKVVKIHSVVIDDTSIARVIKRA